MQTRPKSGIHNPKLHCSLFLTHSEPKTMKQALANKDWLTSMQHEYNALLKNHTWDLVCDQACNYLNYSYSCSVIWMKTVPT